MGHIRESVYIEASPEQAWAVGRDAQRLPEWNTTAIEVKDATGPIDQPGSRYTIVSKIAGRPLDVTWEVQRVEPLRRAEVTGTAPGGGTARQVVEYEPEGTGTRVTVDIEFELPMGILGQFVSKVFAERALARDVRHSSENFKALVEEEVGAAVR